MFKDNNLDLEEFVKELRYKGVEYDPVDKKHWIGSKPFEDISLITNKDMKTMCVTFFGRDYTLLPDPEQRRIRELIFKKLRGELDG